MSFSFTASGTPNEAVAVVGKQAAIQQVPQAFADAVNQQLAGLPADCAVTLTCSGHVGFGQAQTRGSIRMNVEIMVLAAGHPGFDRAKPADAE